jgi:8-oxo-dGTP pyrophosphatase MutT (NUDIX family)
VKLDPHEIRARLLLQPPAEIHPSPSAAAHAAVLVLLCGCDTHPVIVLTRRSEELSRHAGQISLPGGRVHHDESVEAAALREAEEEIGLAPAQVAVLGRLPIIHVSASGFDVTPVVAWLDSMPAWRPDPGEVAEVIDCPAALALDPASYRLGSMLRDGIAREFWYFDFDGHHVWGATARVLRSLALLLAANDEAQPAAR